MRAFLPVIITLLLSSRCFAEDDITASPQATIAGEVKNPGRFELAKAATLNEIFTKITKPLGMGATSRIWIYRDGACRVYDLKKFGDVAVIDGDIVEVSVKYIYEGQSSAQDRVVIVFCEDPNAFLGKVAVLKSDLWSVRRNWHDGKEGIEFRPTGEIGELGGVWVFVRLPSDAELAANVDPEVTPSKAGKSVIVFSRDYGRGMRSIKPSEFEPAVVAAVRNVEVVQSPANPTRPSERNAAGDGDKPSD